MTSPHPGQIVLAGIDILRRRPLTPLAWGAVLAPLGLASRLLDGVSQGLREDWARDAARGVEQWIILGLGGVALFLSCLSMAMLAAATFRAVADPERRDGRWLRLGGDELRLSLIWFLMLAAIMVVFAGIIIVSLAVGFRPDGALAPVILVGAGVALTPLLARFALAPAMTVFEKRLVLGESWRMTRRAYGAAFASTLLFAVIFGGDALLMQQLSSWLSGDPGTLLQGADGPLGPVLDAFRMNRVIETAARLVTGAICGILVYAPLGALYQRLAGKEPADQAAVFD